MTTTWINYILFMVLQVTSALTMEPSNFNLVFATRIHLGQQTTPFPQDELNRNILTFISLAQSSGALKSAIAVDSAEKIQGYNLVEAVRGAVEKAYSTLYSNQESRPTCDVIPLTPWGQFVPALNTLVRWACVSCANAERIVFLSLETHATAEIIKELAQHVILHDTLVAGAALPGHEHQSSPQLGDHAGHIVELTGRTCPWNTLSIWNLKRLAITGFPLLADGLIANEDGSPGAAGIEEFSTILIHQRISQSKDLVKAKLVKLNGLNWEQNFRDDERRKWHEYKMMTKFTRAEQHRALLGGITGSVIHL